MIKDGDRIAVGVSGGKDSMLLVYALTLYRLFSKKDYEITAITVDLGLEGFDMGPACGFMDSIGVKHRTVDTEIGEIVFGVRKEKNPCSLCSKLRKGAFYKAAVEEGCNKAAFAHSADDLIETLLMSMTYEGRLTALSPVTELSRSGVTLIRPMIFLWEKEVIGAVNRNGIPVVKNPCPENGASARTDVRELIKQMSALEPRIKNNLFTAVSNTGNYSLWDRFEK